MLISKTFSVVTPESAEIGDYDDQGFEFDNIDCSFSDMVYELKDLPSPRLNDWDHGSATVYGDESSHIDYRTGAETSHALHFKFENKYEARAFKRAWKVLKARATARRLTVSNDF